jgi:hypothetical protein
VIAEAIDTLFIVCRALLAWIAVGAFVVTVCLFTGIAVIAQGVKGVRRMSAGPSWAYGRFGARMFARARLRRSSGRTEPQAYREAA